MTDPPGRLTGGNHGPNAGASPASPTQDLRNRSPAPVCAGPKGASPATWLRRHRLVRLARRLRDFEDMISVVTDTATTEFTNNEAENDQTRQGQDAQGQDAQGQDAQLRRLLTDPPRACLASTSSSPIHGPPNRASTASTRCLYTLPLHAASTRCLYTLPLHAAPAVHWPCIGPSLHTTRARTHVNSTRTLPAIKSHRAALTFRMRFIREFALLS